MKTPSYIEFHNETHMVLSRILKEAEPEEGCAILIGKKKISAKNNKQICWEIIHIWKCANIWGDKKSKLIKQDATISINPEDIRYSKINRFEIDAQDQIKAQKWSRKHSLEVLCFAHSHPLSDNRPSEIDLFWHQSPGLMIISDKKGNLKAWWIKNKFTFHIVKIEVFSLT
tara:strand:- start:3921 stop:4433 length:513 start_codon:yes stop_codon:yes gene_type:complete